MKRHLLQTSILSLMLTATLSATGQSWPVISVMSDGKWIEVTTEGCGVKKISHDALREMGFSDPSKVTVYGRDGSSLPIAMFDSDGHFLQPLDISPVGAIHIGEAIYFYATGTDIYEFEVNTDYATGGTFRHIGKNIYSANQIFMLTDGAEGLKIESDIPTDCSQWKKITRAAGLIFHEADLSLNDNNNGQLFWGEEFPMDGSTLEWNYQLPGAFGQPAVMQYSLHLESEHTTGPQGEYSFGVKGDTGVEAVTTHTPIRNKTSYHAPQKTEPYEFTMPGDCGAVFTRYDRGGSDCNVANLDWWSVTGVFDINSRILSGDDEFTFAIPSAGDQGAIIPVGQGMYLLDVTNPCVPRLVSDNADVSEAAVDFQGDESRTFAMFRPDGMLPGIIGWREIPNQNLHSCASEGADFAIICLPWLKEKAIEIASLHEAEMGQKCVVATTEEVYREFSCGVPDALAYRNFVKMLHDSNRPVKNLLLMGNMTADARGVRANGKRDERIIAYQKSLSSKHDGAMSDVDIYGIMDPKLSAASGLESMEVAVGVGVLPFSSIREADRYIAKLRRHISGEGMEKVIADHLLIGCDGDNHVHEQQCENIREQLDGYSDGYRHIPVYDDQIGASLSRAKIIETINSGIGLATYIGHGGCLILTKVDGVFGYPDLKYLRNTHTPFMFFAACNITNGDMGQRGMSEQMVVGDRFGLVGAVTSNRTAMSTSNYDLAKTFYSFLHPVSDGKGSEAEVITVGEAYAKTKSRINSANELAFQLMCDPAIVIPVISYSMTDPKQTIRLGRNNTLTGEVVGTDGKIIKGFNGKVSVKLLKAGEFATIGGVVTGTEGPDVKGEDTVLAIGGGEVIDGRYEASIAPGILDIATAESDVKILISAFDPSLRTGAAASYHCETDGADSPDSGLLTSDVLAPTLESVEYDDSESAVILTVTDDTAIDLSTAGLNPGVKVSIDGKLMAGYLLNNVELLPDASRCRHTLYLGNPEPGGHTIAVRLADVNGNSASYERTFNVGESGTKPRLIADCRHTEGKIDFRIESESGSDNLTIHLTDRQGKHVMSVAAQGEVTTVDSGRIPAGIAKAYCEDNTDGSRSRTVALPIIKPQSSR